jgi:hypothetical protein
MIFHCSIASGVLPTIVATLPMRLAEKGYPFFGIKSTINNFQVILAAELPGY